MTRRRKPLPQLDGSLFLTDGGIETTLIFLEGIPLPEFAAFTLLETGAGRAALATYFRTYAELARRHGAGLVLESPTWRASADWGAKLGFDAAALDRINRRAIELLEEVRDEFPDSRPIVISGCIGPRGDGYVPAGSMSAAQAEAFHGPQVRSFVAAAADMVAALTMNEVAEAIGVARAAAAAAIPVAISFTVETDGRLPTGQALGEAIEETDAATGSAPLYYMINCAHPDHFRPVLESGGAWRTRIRGIRANASRMSHAELNQAPDLDPGDPAELGAQYAELVALQPQLNVLGGCCGTDHRHVASIAAACTPLFGAAR